MSSPYLLILWLCSGVGCWSRIKGGGSIVLNNWPSFSILIWSLEGLEGGGSVKRLFFFENFAKSWKKFFSLKLLPGKLLRFEWPLEMESWENELPLLLAWSSLSTPKDGGGYFGGVFFHAKKKSWKRLLLIYSKYEIFYLGLCHERIRDVHSHFSVDIFIVLDVNIVPTSLFIFKKKHFKLTWRPIQNLNCFFVKLTGKFHQYFHHVRWKCQPINGGENEGTAIY